ncbi:hypothetical protein CON65_05385 [Bacillus pseudomycoides]|uniref:4-hydroxy-2-ketovalerate aldolase n=1 Tax=Bacillus pseudomycoides TaxID=64104 RepID=A0AA91VE84_9BACI|nr:MULTISPECIES: hypothetical protein [Bacillus]PEB51689.1 hypothetical protein COO03_15635 [Bacillus sp. AFS098217]PED83657.1 hypothetical protein CON65_05385 [Bacillus pseudomycoides]PEU12355.1 hypothetical protein CN524_13215 [Bacillus sp. AFS019443]PEU21715.1 hypothetical protein CN525_01350 [Bacillus sp. AFS014408]PFW62076.1 hypothetical protein COL20_14590 [Bacillus sp. AFS075034]
MTLLLFLIGLIFVILAIITLSMKKNYKKLSFQEISFLFLLLGIAFFGVCISTYIFRLKVV